jgi:site-specific recombinase XerD
LVDRFFERSFCIDRFRRGPLAGHADKFAALLYDRGYSHSAGRIQLRLIGDFNQWLERKRLGVQDVDEQVLVRYLRYRERRGWFPEEAADTLGRFLETLRGAGVAPAPNCPLLRDHRQEFLNEYRQYLLNERGLAEATLPNLLVFVDRFLAEQFPKGRFAFAALKPIEITRYIQRQAADLSSGRANLLVTALRSFFRYLRHRGDIETDLAGCVPSVAYWSLSSLPKALPRDSVERILKSCDRSTSQGRRDYAILVLLARLGLRGCEIRRLNLEDIDWEHGEITISGKGGRWSKLPLLADVGRAITDYLKHDRPRCATRSLFLTQRAPLGGLRTQCAVYKAVERCIAKAGIDPSHRGVHRFRHTLAAAMLDNGASLGEIGEVLRHRSVNTTRIYAKVDLLALRKLALPWPGGAQ